MDQLFQPSQTSLAQLKAQGISALRDTFSGRSHSSDFAYARSLFLRSRVLVVSLLFLTLLPFWALFDWVLLPGDTLTHACVARVLMAGIFVGLFVMCRRHRLAINWSRIAASALLVTPALFYAWVITVMPPGQHALLGYEFIPYMLVAMLAIFPFTLLESSALGAALICLEMYALHANNVLLTAEGLQAVWLLAALLVIALTANYFQLALMLRLYREATHDPLTGLFNRGALLRAVQQTQSRSVNLPKSLLMMDLDHFKRINDQHGHAAGDDVLHHFAMLLQAELGPQDLIARYGGEEFIAVLMGSGKQAAMDAAERIRERAEAAVIAHPENGSIRYTVSIGVAAFKPGENFETVVRRADSRLYEAKRISRNVVVGTS